MKRRSLSFSVLALLLAAGMLAPRATASSHMDAPLITLDDAVNTTDVYAFVSTNPDGAKVLTTALSVYPFEEPGVGPNVYRFDSTAAYAIHISLGADLATGTPTYSYFFRFFDTFKSRKTILQAYLGVVHDINDAAQNLTQAYIVTAIDWHAVKASTVGQWLVPPNNQGIATPEYNLGAGTGPAKDGVAQSGQLDKYTRQGVRKLVDGSYVFAGQREDGFYGDINALFDLLNVRNPGVDTQAGYNVHTAVVQVPVSNLGGDQQMAGVWAATYRHQITLRTDSLDPNNVGAVQSGRWVQVARQGNPLFNEVFVALEDKDLYSRTMPEQDATLFAKYAKTPEVAALLNALVFPSPVPGIEQNRSDLVGIFVPDVIKVDLSTQPVPLAGGGPNHPTNPDDPGFSRLSVFGGDTVFSPLQNKMIASGWPNGRRFGDDVVDIGLTAIASDLISNPPVIRPVGDNVDHNDIPYNKVMPYAATPLNGRVHTHH